MIALFTDFGHDGLYVGQMHALIGAALPEVTVVDLCHTIPPQNICSAAYLIPAYTRYLPPSSIVICIIDPGVGSDRPHALCEADGRWYIGPDNGQFDVLAQHALSFKKYHFQWMGDVSYSFHGRDIYTPAACLLAESQDHNILNCQLAKTTELRFSSDLNEIIYFDHFGNALTGFRCSEIGGNVRLVLKDRDIQHAKTFSDVKAGQCLWYENANGLVEIAVNQGSARDIPGLVIGDSFSITEI
jgi:S-adenosylmethionine hydrolase